MKITNKHKLPKSLVSAIENDPYRGIGDISTTRTIAPYQIVALQKKCASRLSEDVSNLIYPLVGNNTHYIIERVNVPGTVKEWRFYLTVSGWLLSGQIDLWENGVLSDWKVTSVWSVIHGIKPEHEAQMNVNAYLIRNSPYADSLPIKKLQIVNILRDWSMHKVKKDNPDYPKCQVKVQNVKMWGMDKTAKYIKERIYFHQMSEGVAPENLIWCTPEERWEKPTTYAVKSKKRVTAHRVLDTMEAAEKWMTKTGKGEYIETRIGKSVRCEDYCNVNRFCKQYERMNNENGNKQRN